jgi:glycosyltransferase involved in cell wall biosynthesis
MMKNILVLLPRVPYPQVDGASKANFQFISGLASSGYHVTAICIAPKKEETHLEEFKQHAKIHEAFFVDRPTTEKWKAFKLLYNFLKSPLKPVTYFHFFDHQLTSFINLKRSEKQFYEIIAITPHCVIPLLKMNTSYIYRSENVEYELWEQSKTATKNLLKKIFFNLQEILVRKLEKRIIQNSKLTLTISNEDKEKYIKLSPRSSIEMIPMSFHFPPPIPYVEKERIELFYLGKLDWQPNLDGLVWFLKEVWPNLNQEAHHKLHLTIAGSGNPTTIKNVILQMPKNTNITFLGRIEKIEEHYKHSDLVVAPIFYGSGTRIKILEASLFGRPCLSTQLGFQGSPVIFDHKSAGGLKAETKEDWIRNLENLNRKELTYLGTNAYHQCKEVLDFDVTSNKIKNLILKLHPESDDHHR